MSGAESDFMAKKSEAMNGQRNKRPLHAVVSWLRGIVIVARIAITVSFFCTACLEAIFQLWGDVAWHLIIAIAVCPVWDEAS